MKRLLDRIDRSRLHLAANTSLAIVLSIGIAFWLNLSATITAITALMIQQGYVGATMRWGLLRFAGGTAGAIAGMALLACFSQDREVFIFAVALGVAIFCFLLQATKNWYAYIIAVAAMVLVAYGNIEHPQSAFQFSVYWVSGIGIAVVVVSVVHGLLWSPTTAGVFDSGLRDSFGQCREFVQLMMESMFERGERKLDFGSIEHKVIRGLPKLRAVLQTAAFDNWRIEKYEDSYQSFLDQAELLVSRVIAVQEHVKICQAEPTVGEAIRQSRVCQQILQSLVTQIGHLMDALDAPRDGRSEPALGQVDVKFRSLLESLGKEFEGVTVGLHDNGLLVGMQLRLHQLGEQVLKVRQTLATVETSSSLEIAQSAGRRGKQSDPPLAPRLVKSIRAFLVMIAIPCIWILTDWPMALTRLMLFSAVLACLSCLLPVIPRRAVFHAIGIGAVGGAILYFGILPMLDGYPELAVALSLSTVPYCYLVSSPRPEKMITGLLGGMIMFGLIDLSLVQEYSYSNYMNNLIGYSGGFIIGMIILSLFDTSTPEQTFCDKAKLFFTLSEQAFEELTTNPPWTDHGQSALASQQGALLKVHFTCTLWLKMFHPQHTSEDDSGSLKSLLESMEVLVFRQQMTEGIRQQPPDLAVLSPLMATEQQLRTSIANGLRSVRDTIRGGLPEGELPDIGESVLNYQHQLEALRENPEMAKVDRETTSHFFVLGEYYRALALILEECLRTAKATDWRRLGISYI